MEFTGCLSVTELKVGQILLTPEDKEPDINILLQGSLKMSRYSPNDAFLVSA